MFKIRILTTVLLASGLLLSACGEKSEGEKAADKINESINTATQVATTGEKQYAEALIFEDELTQGRQKRTLENVNKVIALFQKAIDSFNSAHSGYRQALDIHGDNKEQVKLKGKEVITNSIAILESYLADAKKRQKRWQDFKKTMTSSQSSSKADRAKKQDASKKS